MPTPSAIRIYPDPTNSSRKSFVVLQSDPPRWFVTNRTGLEVYRLLANGKTAEEAEEFVCNHYGVSRETASHDVAAVAEQLRQILTSRIRAVSPPRLRALILDVTNRCNLTCAHCYLESGPGQQDLPLELALDVIEQFTQTGGRSITIGGGEPLCHRGIEQILELACDRATQVRMLTNGTVITRELALRLARENLEVQVSLDSVDAVVHEAIRGTGAFERVMEGLAVWTEVLGPEKVILSATVMRTNFEGLPALADFAEELGISRLRFLPLRVVGRAKRGCEAPSLEEYGEFFQQIAGIQRSRTGRLKLSWGLAGFLLELPPENPNGSWCPVGNQIVVAATGDVYPCPLLIRPEYRLGDVREMSLQQLMEAPAMQECRRAVAERPRALEKCASCTWVSLCQAGCMGLARDEGGTIWQADPYCECRLTAYPQAFDLLVGRDENR